MATASKFTPRKTAAKTAAPVAKTAAKTAAKPADRRRVVPVASSPTAADLHTDEPIVGHIATPQEEWDAQEQVEVFVKHAFKFTTDDHVVHDIAAGTQEVPREWFEHSYFRAHGVEETQARKSAK